MIFLQADDLKNSETIKILIKKAGVY